ncbi:cellulose synthase-like protein E6 [Amborella trichopoda]|nr:cellulose synthase-like protein E6 [Amborella trichopoda]|eukprot:XP_006857764.3 cellulose synthase-like protein E6 [Amborella trichopoda]
MENVVQGRLSKKEAWTEGWRINKREKERPWSSHNEVGEYLREREREKLEYSLREREMGKVDEEKLSLYGSVKAKGMFLYRLFGLSFLCAVLMVLYYRLTHVTEGAQWFWMAIFASEVWFTFYWVLNQSVRWNPVYRHTFKDRLSKRYEKELPGVDIFVCTADPYKEPPMLVMGTVLSLMAYDYPTHKLSVYLSDDGASEFTFYALLEAAKFAKHWLPFCKKFQIEPRAPKPFFSSMAYSHKDECSTIKKMFEEMEERIEAAVKLGRIPEDIRCQHKGFLEWDKTPFTSRDHSPIVQILIGGGDSTEVDMEGIPLPTLVYLAREKNPNQHHNFKAGAMNSLIRVSSVISNAPIILNVDCDMYSNDSKSIRDALCFLMDEETGHDIAFVQFPQNFDNMTKNELYDGFLRAIGVVDFPGMDGLGGTLYVGSGCFHRRSILGGKMLNEEFKEELSGGNWSKSEEKAKILEERGKDLATCTYELGTEWGKEVGLKYGCPVEDVITGLSIHCRGWRSVYYNPTRKAFLGVASTTLGDTLVQSKRWSEGDFQILLSKYCPFVYGWGKMSVAHMMSYSIYLFWPVNSLPTWCYALVPSLCLLNGVPLYPKVTSPWCIPFAFVAISSYGSSLHEMLLAKGTLKSWWNAERMWMIRRVSSYLFAFIDSILKLVGLGESGFDITTKVSDEDAMRRHEQEIMEFGGASPMFVILATLTLFNLIAFLLGLKRVITQGSSAMDSLMPQLILSGFIVSICFPIFEALFIRRDKGRLPISVAYTSIVLVLLISYIPIF